MAQLFEIAEYRTRAEPRAPSTGPARGASAEILIYTGIRYERMEPVDRPIDMAVPRETRADARSRRGA